MNSGLCLVVAAMAQAAGAAGRGYGKPQIFQKYEPLLMLPCPDTGYSPMLPDTSACLDMPVPLYCS